MRRIEALTNSTATPMRRCNFDGICWSRDDHDLDTQTKNKPTDDELWKSHASRDDDGADDDDPSTNEHALAAAEFVRNDGTEGRCDNRTTADRTRR